MRDDPIGARLALHSVGETPPVSCEAGAFDATRPEVRLAMRGRDGVTFTLAVAPFAEGANCYRRTGELALSHRDGEHTKLAESYFTFLTRSLREITFAQISAWTKECYPEVAQADPLVERVVHVREGQPYSRGGPERWAQFHSTAHRGLGESVRFLHRMAGVLHQDPECLVFPEIFARPLKFIKYPWVSRARWPFQPYVPRGAKNEELRRPQTRMLTTQMGEREVILGGNAAVRGALKRLADDDWHELATLAFTCTPQVIGDDLNAAVRCFAERTDRPLLHAQDEREHPARPVIRLLREAVGRGEAKAGDPGRFNLVGYQPEQLSHELAVLDRVGLPLNVSVLPDIHLGDCERYGDAALQVVNPQGYLERFVDEIFSRLEAPIVRAEPPLGWAASRKWCARVAAAAAQEEPFDEPFERVWESRSEALRKRWDNLRGGVHGRRLGFVVSDGGLDEHRSGRAFQGLPLLEALREMGFSFDFLVRDGVGGAEANEGDRVVSFARPAELRAALEESEAAAFYSEYNYDWRLSTTGKAAFSFHDFGFGARGAVGNLRYLLNLCDATFARCRGGRDERGRWRRLEAMDG